MLAAPAGPAQGRISQLLPSVTCSSCGDPVPLSELADHVCKPAPPMPSQPSKLALLTQRINQMSSRNPRESQASQASSRSSYYTQRSVSPSGTARAPSPARSPSPASTVRSQSGLSDRSGRHTRVPSRTAPSSREPSPSSSQHTRAISPARRARSPAQPIPVRAPSAASTVQRIPSAASYRSNTPSDSERGKAASLPRAPSAASNRSQRRPSNASVHPPPPGSMRAFSPHRQMSGGPSSYRASPPPPPTLQPPPPGPMRRPSFGTPQPFSQHPGPPHGQPMNGPPLGRPPLNMMMPGLGRGPSPVGPPLSPAPLSPGHHSIFDERDIDTKIGGEAGMAGVGRRGFAAAARAAMFAVHPQPGMGPYGASLAMSQAPMSMGGRRPNAPPFVDIGASVPALPPLGSMGSPLSLSPHSPSPLSPRPALSPRSPSFGHGSSPSTGTLTNTGSTVSTSPTIATPPSPTPTNGSIPRLPPGFNKPGLSPVSTVPFPRSPGSLDSVTTEPLTPTDPGDTARALYFDDKPTPRPPRERERDDDSDEESIDDMALRLSRELEDLAMDLLPNSRPASRTSNASLSDDDGGGLAYASSERSSVFSHHRVPSVASIGSRHGRTPSTASQPADRSTSAVRALSINKSKSQPVTPTSDSDSGRPFDNAPPLPPLDPRTRSDSRASAASASSAYSHRRAGSRGFGPTLNGTSNGTGDGPDAGPPDAVRARTASGLRDEVDGGAPGAWGIVRAKTATAVSSTPAVREPEPRRGGTISGAIGVAEERGRKESSTKKVRRCVKDGTLIEDGRWVRVESGKGVLCEKCWKGMYLPKCRRCGLAIEKQAVSSSDGQLKGKYHRECFSCTTCQKPFPDKEFYVFDGRPYCDYHYHQANGSLCSAPACGRPIEGPCAVSHSGAKYHPEHLTCEHVDSDDDGDSGSDYSDDDEDSGALRRRLGRSTVGPGTRNRTRRARVAHAGGRCTTRLEEYWEVDGRMLCERHMRRVMGTDRMRDERAKRRVTRFIDLTDFR